MTLNAPQLKVNDELGTLADIMRPAVIIALVMVALALIALEGHGIYLVVRDSRRRSGKWGINRRPVICSRCQARVPRFRLPTSWRQAMWGGWTCRSCGCEMDKWGVEIESSQMSSV